MSKIVQAINAMISNSEKISDIYESPYDYASDEYFFVYNRKYVWSISKNDSGAHTLYFYPKARSSQEMAQVHYEELSQHPMIAYGSEKLSSKEARESIGDLYTIVKEKLYNVDAALDDIIGDDIPF
jgi:hypothetical protein